MAMNVIDTAMQEMNRVREVIKEYELVENGQFAAKMMQLSISVAEQAVSSGDVVLIIQCIEDLRGWEL